MKFLLLSTLSLLSVSAIAQKTLRMVVHEEPKDCRRMMEQKCLQVQIDGSKDWTLFYDKIEGFDYEPGFRYEIAVIETPRPEPVPQDISANTYALKEVFSKSPVTGGTADVPLWKVVSIKGLGLNSDMVYFDFNEDSTMISGKSGCNQFSMPVAFNSKKTKFQTKMATSTLMACPDDQMKQEAAFLDAIQNKKFKIRKKDGQVIWRKGFKNVLVTEQFVPVKADIISNEGWDRFDGKTMKVIQLNGKTLTETKAHMIFDSAKGKFSGNSGCNMMSGNFSSEGTAINFSSVISTKMACVDETMQQTEREILAILNSRGLSYDVAEKVVNIYAGNGQLVMMLAL